jgi:hypothetical protein
MSFAVLPAGRRNGLAKAFRSGGLADEDARSGGPDHRGPLE